MGIADRATSGNRKVGKAAPTTVGDGDWLRQVAKGACLDAGGVSEELLGDYLLMLAEAAISGRRPDRNELAAVRLLGRRAAETGVSAGHGVNLYLSAARRVWDELPAVVRIRNSAAVRAAAEAVLQVVEDAVAAFAEGHGEAGRELVRREETQRRELIDDLLRGDAHLGELVERAEPFGLDLTRAHQVALARPEQRLPVAEAAISFLGFGIQPPTPAWGSMLSESRDFLYVAWRLALFAGGALALTALGVNLLGDWLRDTMDPKLRV